MILYKGSLMKLDLTFNQVNSNKEKLKKPITSGTKMKN